MTGVPKQAYRTVSAFPGMAAAPRAKQPPEHVESGPDALADSILYLAAHHGRALTHQALLAGLPITDGRAAGHAL